MTDSPASGASEGSTAKAPWKPLNSRQRRVLGVLVEKAKTTPDAYPLTVNAIVTGSNQKSNREPLMNLTSDDVEEILEELRALGVVTEVQGSGRVAKYRHHAYEWLGVDAVELAVMTELLLRGEQTLGELRTRASRMEPIADLHALKGVVDRLVGRGLMVELTPAGRGQVVSHRVYKDRELTELHQQFAGHVPSSYADDDEPATPVRAAAPAVSHAASPSSASAPVSASAVAPTATPAAAAVVTVDMFSELTIDIAELRAEVARLRQQVNELSELLK